MVAKILVIDDSSDMRGMLKAYLELEGYFVILANDGFDALQKLAQDPEPSLILLDMIMERMDGKAFLEHLQSDYPDTFKNVPIVAMSAMESQPVTGVAGFLAKPFDIDSLSQTLQRFCRTASA